MPGRLIAIGDVHGCIHALDALLGAIAPTASDTLVLLGDMVDYGRDSREVLERLIELPRYCRVVLIEGNHEEMMLWARDSEPALRYWENHGGVATLNSYRFPGRLAEIPDEHWELIARSQPYLETDEYIFTHANYQADLPMDQQSDHEIRWSLFDPAEARPHFSGKPVTLGHTEQRNGEILDLGFATCIDTACWRYGWLTALDRRTGYVWQASKWGMLRAEGEANHRDAMSELLATK
jgi:serine/threonine protein phosphatase 1